MITSMLTCVIPRISSLQKLALMLNELYDLLILRKPHVAKKVDREPYNRTRYYDYSRDPKKAFGEFYTYLYKVVTPPCVYAIACVIGMKC